jgi:phenylacetate-CoA ligase
MNKLFEYFNYPDDIDSQLADFKEKQIVETDSQGWERLRILSNFVLKNVPAYKKYLNEQGVFIDEIESIDQFKKLPLINKTNYILNYSLKDLIPEGYLKNITTFSSTSGSSGKRCYLPRGEEQDLLYEYIAELLLKNQFKLEGKSTLCLLGFGLGIWIGGIFTYKVFNSLAQKGYPIAVAPIGPNKDLFLDMIQEVGSDFDQIFLLGYPPFLKDIIDESLRLGIDLKKHDIKILTATEAFSEEYRDYLVEKTGINPLLDIVSIYGTAEIGTMAHETPLAILIRKLAIKDPNIFKMLFPDASQLPTLAQYYPDIIYFEEEKGELIASGFGSSYPLLRYQFFDKGGVISFQEMISKFTEIGIDLLDEASKAGISDTVLKIPFVYVYERSDFVLTIYGINIYPVYIRNALLDSKVEKYVTGKFSMIKKQRENFNQYLEINIELKNEVAGSKEIENIVAEVIFDSFYSESTEFRYLSNNDKSIDLKPLIILHSYNSEKYFQLDIKQNWIIKN